jgi:thiol:disulfide interchange protein DsbC
MKKIITILMLSFILVYAKNNNLNKVEKDYIKSIVPSTKFIDIKRSNTGYFVGCMESGDILYINAFKKMIFFGEFYTNNGQTLTGLDRKWCSSLTDFDFKSLSIKKIRSLKDNSIKVSIKKGSDKEFIIFKSPVCPHCQILDQEISKMSITTYQYYSLMNESVKEVESKHNIKNAKKFLEKQFELTKEFNIKGVPFILVIKDNKVVDTIKGANIPKIKKHLGI